MPYKDKIKKKIYYDTHIKHYRKEWIGKNRDYWNGYQKKYKVEKRIQVCEEIKDLVTKLNICEPDTLTFKAAVILIFMIQTGISKEWVIAYRNQYNIMDVKKIIANWKSNKLYQNNTFNMEPIETDLEEILQITLFSMAGSGEIRAIKLH